MALQIAAGIEGIGVGDGVGSNGGKVGTGSAIGAGVIPPI